MTFCNYCGWWKIELSLEAKHYVSLTRFGAWKVKKKNLPLAFLPNITGFLTLVITTTANIIFSRSFHSTPIRNCQYCKTGPFCFGVSIHLGRFSKLDGWGRPSEWILITRNRSDLKLIFPHSTEPVTMGLPVLVHQKAQVKVRSEGQLVCALLEWL